MTTGGIVLLVCMCVFMICEVFMIIRDRLRKKHDAKYQELCSIVESCAKEFELPKNEVARKLLYYAKEQELFEVKSSGAPIDPNKS